MRSGFTLIEVVAAAMIATIAGIALLQMNSQSGFLFSRLTEKAAAAERLSIVGNHADPRFNHTTKSLYDLLGGMYAIENDELRRYLEKEKFDYSEQKIETAGFDTDAMPEVGEQINDAQLQDAAAAPVIQFELMQVGIKNSSTHGAVLVVRPL